MELGLSVLADERSFVKAMRRIRPRLQPLLDAFAETRLQQRAYEAILVGVTDYNGPELFEEVPNNDGYFQVLAGCSATGSDDELAHQVFEILRRAMRACPLDKSDHETLEALFGRFESLVVDE